MPATRLLLGLLVLGLVCAPGGPAGADERSEGDVEKALHSPLAAVRRQAVHDTIARGAAALPLARRWSKSEDRRLRRAAWQVLAKLGRDADGRAALRAGADNCPAVAAAAMRCALDLSAALPPPDDPWLPSGGLVTGARRPLALALAHDFDLGDPEVLPPCVHRLGEGLIPVLETILEHARFGVAAKRDALKSLAAIGGEHARRVLSAQVKGMDGSNDPRWNAWWHSVNNIDVGRGLAGAQEYAVALASSGAFSPWARGARRLHWRDRMLFFRFLSHAPPGEGADEVRRYLENQIALAAENARRRFYPSLASAVVRACLINCEPTDALLETMALCAQPRTRGGSRRRMEELGEVLVLLAPYRNRQGVKDGTNMLLMKYGLPRTVRAWAYHLQGSEPRDKMVARAEDLIDAGGKAATLAQRRLGARLLGDLGSPSLQRIRSMLYDLDAWMRAMGIDWLQRAVSEGVEGAEAMRQQLLPRLLNDPADSVFLVAAERHAGPLDGAMRDRLLRMAVQGTLSTRGRVWRLVERALPAASESSEAFRAPGGYAALDERIRAAGHARALWAR